MKTTRLAAAFAGIGIVTLLSGCVVAPVGRPVAYYSPGPVYVEPAAVVVVPQPGYYGYRGYRGYRGYQGYGHWR